MFPFAFRFDQEKENIEVPRPVIIQHGGIFLENLQFVLQTITNAIITRQVPTVIYEFE